MTIQVSRNSLVVHSKVNKRSIPCLDATKGKQGVGVEGLVEDRMEREGGRIAPK
jgi:hypothetical protein